MLTNIIYESIEHQKFNPSNAILSELFQVGKLGLITDQQLKNKLFEWTREIERNNSSYQLYEKWTEEQVILYYSKNIALKNIDMYSPMGWKEKSKFESGTYGIFNDREYENILDNELYHIALLTDEYKNIEEIIDVIISRTKSEK